MTNKWILESLQNAVCKGGHFLFRQGDCWFDFLKNKLLDKGANFLVVQCLANGIDTAKVGNGHHCCVGAVQNFYLALLVRCDVICKDNVQAGFVGRQFALDELVLFEYPKVENFPFDNIVIHKARLLPNLLNGVAWVTGDNAVYKCVGKVVGVVKPIDKRPVHFADFRKLVKHLFERLTVVVNQFARDDCKAFGHIPTKVVVSLLQKGQKFTWEGCWTMGKIYVVGIQNDACFGGVGNNNFQIFAVSVTKVLLVVFVRVDKVVQDIDDLTRLHHLALVDTLQTKGVQAILLGKVQNSAHWHRLNNNHATTKDIFIV